MKSERLIYGSNDIEGISKRIASDGYAYVRRSGAHIVMREEDEEDTTDDDNSDDEHSADVPVEEGFEIVISDESVDSHDTVFLSAGWEIEAYNRNPLVTWQHPWLDEENPDMFIGTGTARIEGGKLISIFRWEPGDTNDIVRKLKNKVNAKMIKSASIVARVEAGSWGVKENGEDPEVFYFRKQRLITYGLVAFPSNGNAMIVEKTKERKPEDEEDKKISKQKAAIAKAIAKVNVAIG